MPYLTDNSQAVRSIHRIGFVPWILIATTLADLPIVQYSATLSQAEVHCYFLHFPSPTPDHGPSSLNSDREGLWMSHSDITVWEQTDAAPNMRPQRVGLQASVIAIAE